MPPHRIRLDAQRHAAFLAENRKDPITFEPLRAGMEVVLCANEKIAFIADNWPGQCPRCNCSNTLDTIPTNNFPTHLRRRNTAHPPTRRSQPTSTRSPRRHITTRRVNRSFQIIGIFLTLILCVCILGFLGILFLDRIYPPHLPLPTLIPTLPTLPTSIPIPTITPSYNGTYLLNTTCSEFPDLTIIQIIVSDLYIQVEFRLNSSTEESKVHLAPPETVGAFYLVSKETSERLALKNISGSIAIDPDWTEVKKGDVLQFTLTFEKISNATQTIDIIEGDSRDLDVSYFDCLNVTFR
jgi:hypothetical protein